MAYSGPIAFPVIEGGTGDTSFTAYAPVCGGTSTTGALQSASTGLSTSGYVLTSNGSSSLPSFQAASGGSGGAKAWGNFSSSASTATLSNSFNVSSITGNFPNYVVNLTSGFSNSNYVVLTGGPSSGAPGISIINSTSFTLNVGSSNSTYYFACFGN